MATIRKRRVIAAVACAVAAASIAGAASAQKPGGILKIYTLDSPASMSIHEEATVASERPMMGVFNNLVMYRQDIKRNSLDAIVPELATEWSWNEDGTELSFTLRQGVKWHDGKPFTAADVKCTWDMVTGRAEQKFRVNPRKSNFRNVDEVRVADDRRVAFRLKRPQPAFLALLASGFAPIYPCHVPPAQMRQHPIGTGPFKFIEFKPNEHIKLVKNPDYWKPDRPYLDGIEYTIVKSQSTATLAFVTGKFDMTFPYTVSVPLLKDVRAQKPDAICELAPTGVSRNLIVNREVAPFDNPELRRAMALSLDRRAFIDIISDGQGDIGGAMQPAPEGLWGMPQEMLRELPGYDPDVQKNRKEARRLMETIGYGRDNRLKVKVSTRDLPFFRDPAVILIDQLKEAYIEGELETIETTNWFPKIMRRDYAVGLNLSGSGPDPDQALFVQYGCGGELNYSGYCNRELDKLIETQSAEPDQEERKLLIWQIERRLAEDGARPNIFYNRGGTCWHPYVKGLTIMVNSISNGWRMEDVWLDR
jgi:peptide/nickel transport system substrate-binding protein